MRSRKTGRFLSEGFNRLHVVFSTLILFSAGRIWYCSFSVEPEIGQTK